MYLLILMCLMRPLLSIQSNQQPILQEIFLPKNLNENQTVRLSCALIQGDNVAFTWYFNDQKLIENDRKKVKLGDGSADLLIKQLSVSDIGRYQCVASNEFDLDKKDVDLIFDVKPSWIIEPQDTTLPLNRPLVINCTARGHPRPTTRNIKLHNDNTTHLKEFDTSVVKLNFTRETAGFYKCKSSNNVGKIEKTILSKYFV